MMRILCKWSTAWVFVAVFLLWRFGFPEVLSFHEQQQLFLFTTDYFLSRMAEPGGVARYVAEFIVQYYNNFNLGAVLLASLVALAQWLTSRIAMRHCTDTVMAMVLSLLLPSLIVGIMGDADVMTTFIVSLDFCLLGIMLLPKSYNGMAGYSLALIPIGYWIAGPVMYVFALYVLTCLWMEEDSHWKALATGCVLLVEVLVCVLGSQWLTDYPLERLVRGIDYYRYPMNMVPYGWVVFIVALYPLVAYFKNNEWALRAAICAVALSVAGITSSFKRDYYEQMEYDLLLRMQRWNAIIKKANEKEPKNSSCSLALGLALFKKGMISTEQFASQIHPKDMGRDRFSASVLGESYYHLGLVNTARRYAFEQMESITNYNRSGRLLKRLAETALVSGHRRLTRTYLNILRNTTFYSTWADETMALLNDRKALESHPVYGRLLYSFPKKDIILSSSKKYQK